MYIHCAFYLLFAEITVLTIEVEPIRITCFLIILGWFNLEYNFLIRVKSLDVGEKEKRDKE